MDQLIETKLAVLKMKIWIYWSNQILELIFFTYSSK